MISDGLIYFSITVVVLLVIGGIGWKYLTSVSRYENRKKEIALGIACIILTFANFLFLPIILCNSNDAFIKIIGGMQNVVVETSHENFLQERDSRLNEIVTNLVQKYPEEIKVPENILPEETDKFISNFKENGITSALDIAKRATDSKGKNFRQSLDSAFEDLKNNGLLKEISSQEKNNLLDEITYEQFKPFNEGAISTYFSNGDMNSILRNFFTESVKGTSFKKYMGVPDKNETWNVQDVIENNANEFSQNTVDGVKKMLPKFFIIFGVILCFVCLILFSIILFYLRESELQKNKDFDKNHIFEYQSSVFEDINREKK